MCVFYQQQKVNIGYEHFLVKFLFRYKNHVEFQFRGCNRGGATTTRIQGHPQSADHHKERSGVA